MRPGTSRRDFIRQAALAGAAVGLAGLTPPFARRAWSLDGDAPTDKLKVLILGGTGQTGPHLIEELVRRGHTVTMFNRGTRSEELFPAVECLIGDRQPEPGDGLKALEAEIAGGRSWDICIDIWPQIPKIVENTAVLLKGHVGHYMFVSSISVYVDFATPGADETSPVGQAPDADTTTYTDELFGPFKAECENRVRKHYPENHTVFRPGLIVGPRDASFRGGYWPVRVRRGGEVLAPGDGTTAVQVIDGRDLTAFEVLCMERRTGGTFDVTGPNPAIAVDHAGDAGDLPQGGRRRGLVRLGRPGVPRGERRGRLARHAVLAARRGRNRRLRQAQPGPRGGSRPDASPPGRHRARHADLVRRAARRPARGGHETRGTDGRA
jgi:2'-hydroxyisoflavone reductase